MKLDIFQNDGVGTSSTTAIDSSSRLVDEDRRANEGPILTNAVLKDAFGAPDSPKVKVQGSVKSSKKGMK